MAIQQSWISYFSNLVKQHGGINLAQGIPGFDPPPHLLDALREYSDKPVHQYAPGLGNHRLREHIFQMYDEKLPRDRYSLMITNGATEAIHLLYMSFHLEGAPLTAAAFTPVYESYIHLPRIYGDSFYTLEMDNSKGQLPQKLEKFFEKHEPQVFFVNTPGNPYGSTLDKQSFNKLVELSREYKCKLLIDAVYDQIYFDTPPYYPFHQFHDHVYYINSFSKLYSVTGWRTGYFFCDPSVFPRISDIHDYTGLCSPSILQESLARFMDNSHQKETYVAQIRSRIKENFYSSASILKDAGFQIPEAHGGYFLWAVLPGHIPCGIQFAKQLYKEEKTAVIPGEHFGKAYKNYIRINIARKEEELSEGLRRIVSHASL